MIRVIVTSLVVPIFVDSIANGRITILPIKKICYLYNIISVMLLYTFLNIFIRQYQINFLIIITFFFVLSLTMYYVHEFRGTNVNMSDILSINTAKEVASGYTYEIKPIAIFSFIIIVLEYILQILYYKISFSNNFSNISLILNSNITRYNLFWYEIKKILLFLFLFFLLRDIISKNQYDYSLKAGEKEGYIYNFYSSIPFFHKKNINNLDSNKIKLGVPTFNLDTKNAQNFVKINNIESKPHVIVIMNESFGSVHRRIKTNIPVTPYYDSLNDVVKGDLYVNTFGGGTANTEFEFLTGVSIGNYQYPVMPYNNFVKNDKYSLARYFKNLGYKTIAMHPYTATNYNRDKVYKRFGFDELLFFEDFNNKKYVRNFISDTSMYEEVIKRYEDLKNNNEKAFIFGITMQNHSGYSKFECEKVESLIDGISASEKETLDSYLSLMKISDESIKILIDYFKNEKENVVLLFFGDHNASFGTKVNSIVYDMSSIYECTNAYATPYFIYNNHESNLENVKEISANFLSLKLLKDAKLPFDDIHILINNFYENYNIYNYHKRKSTKDLKLYDIGFDELENYKEEYLK